MPNHNLSSFQATCLPISATCSITVHAISASFWLHSRSCDDLRRLRPAGPSRSYRFTFPLMARDHPRRCPQQQVQRLRCPSCSKRFTDILRHLNHRQSKCANWLNTTSPHHRSLPYSYKHFPNNPTDPPIPEYIPSTRQSPSPPPPHYQPHAWHVEFPGAAKTHGQMKTFMDKFDDDQYSGFRTTNTYYPFAGKSEWELASFLLSSGLSMRKIDDFLWLKMVILSILYLVIVY